MLAQLVPFDLGQFQQLGVAGQRGAGGGFQLGSEISGRRGLKQLFQQGPPLDLPFGDGIPCLLYTSRCV